MYSVNWATKVISIPVSDMILISGADYTLDMSSFHKEIRRLEWEFDEGFWADQILKHTVGETVSGATYPPFDVIINGYTITFDPTAEKVFLSGSNNNIVDVFNYNGVSVIPSNSAGNTVTTIQGGGVEDLATKILDILEGDVVPTPSEFSILHKVSKVVLVQKDANEVNGLTQLTET